MLLRAAGCAWTEADVPLLDEAAELLGEMDASAGRDRAEREHDRARDVANAEQSLRNVNEMLRTPASTALVSAEDLAAHKPGPRDRLTAAERAAADRTWAFGHIVVDEAQELSPMQWRLLMRRCPLKSFTIVGDIAQTSSSAGAQSWQQALEPFAEDRWRLEELTVNYRTPAQIAEAAVRVANAAGQVVSAPKAVREGQMAPVVDRVDRGEVASTLMDAVPQELGLLDGGLLAVIAAEHRFRTAAPGPGRSLRRQGRRRCRRVGPGHRCHGPQGGQGPGVRRRGVAGTGGNPRRCRRPGGRPVRGHDPADPAAARRIRGTRWSPEGLEG